MRITRIRLENFGPFETLEEIKVGNLSTFVGRNDVGKSHILKALDIFFENSKISESNVCLASHEDVDTIIEVAFDELPEEIQLEDNIPTNFQEEKLVDENGLLRIKKVYPRNNLGKPQTILVTHDFEEDLYAGLSIIKEQELNKRCENLSIDVSRSGAGITNKSKREALRDHAETNHLPGIIRNLELGSDNVQKVIKRILPDYVFFKTDTPLGVGQSMVQSTFKPFVKSVFDDEGLTEKTNELESKMQESLQTEVNKIHQRLRRHTDAFTELYAKPVFQWDKAVGMDITGKDTHGTEIPLEARGSGMQRLVMVSYFEYVAEEKSEGDRDIVYAIEEPENCLHPGLQRELMESFRILIEEGYQVLLTSHSPVFAGISPVEDLTLIRREHGRAFSTQVPQLTLDDVALELGIGPSDQLFGYDGIVFVEGPDDEPFFKSIATKLKEAGELPNDFDEVNLGFVITGGDNLKHWVDRKVMRQLTRSFCVIVDSDRTRANDPIPSNKLRMQLECQQDGGTFIILQKRAIENYIHEDALTRRGIRFSSYDDFTHMRPHIGRKDVWKTIFDMTAQEILDKDMYIDNGQTHHELKEIIETIMALV
ncbi:MAG: ATP-binding protein [Candidatus Thorarchaeota archaeon]